MDQGGRRKIVTRRESCVVYGMRAWSSKRMSDAWTAWTA